MNVCRYGLVTALLIITFMVARGSVSFKKHGKHQLKRSVQRKTLSLKAVPNSSTKMVLDKSDIDLPSTALAQILQPTSTEGDLLHMQSSPKSKRSDIFQNSLANANSKRQAVSIKSIPSPRDETLPQDAGGAEIGEDGKDKADGSDDDDDDDDSGSGGDEDDNSHNLKDAVAESTTHRGKSSKKEDIEARDTTGRKHSGPVCSKRCSTPMTYEECALPRCDLKMGSIKDLCFFLCKHQKEHCEDVCDDS